MHGFRIGSGETHTSVVTPIDPASDALAAALRQAHVNALEQGDRRRERYANEGQRLQAELLKIVKDEQRLAAERAAAVYREHVAGLEADLDKFIRQQATNGYRDARRAMNVKLPDDLKGVADLSEDIPSGLLTLILNGSDWRTRLVNAAGPRSLIGTATILARRRIDLPTANSLPLIDSIIRRLTDVARGIAREEGMRASNAAAQIAVETAPGIEDVLIGWMVRGILDNRIRPKHRLRDHTIYYRNPVGDQLGYFDMPDPPYESARDHHEKAHNCRCWLVPVFRKVYRPKPVKPSGPRIPLPVFKRPLPVAVPLARRVPTAVPLARGMAKRVPTFSPLSARLVPTVFPIPRGTFPRPGRIRRGTKTRNRLRAGLSVGAILAALAVGKSFLDIAKNPS